MPWREVTLSDSRFEFITLALQDGVNFSELCNRFNISRKTGYKWLDRFEQEGKSGLEDRSRRPHCSPLQTKAKIEELILSQRNLHPAWGGHKLKAKLQNQGCIGIPAASTITQILRREDRIDPKDSIEHQPCQHFEHEHPNALWQMDFKGDFPTDAGRCHPLTMLDDHSRYNLMLKACSNQQGQTVQSHLIDTFKRYGLPLRMLMDNGSPWGGCGADYPLTPLCVWLIRLGIQISHGKPYHPQTQGKEERFHRTLKAELIGCRRFVDLTECQRQFDQWRHVYNHERPHESLGMQPPSSRYKVSVRSYPSKLPEIEYGALDCVRTVYDNGMIHFQGNNYRVGKPFIGYPVGIRPTLTDGIFEIYFCHQKIAQIDLRSPVS